MNGATKNQGFDYDRADRAQQASLRGEELPSKPEPMDRKDALRLVRMKAADAVLRLPRLTGDVATPTRQRRIEFVGFTADLPASLAAQVVRVQRELDRLIEMTHGVSDE